MNLCTPTVLTSDILMESDSYTNQHLWLFTLVLDYLRLAYVRFERSPHCLFLIQLSANSEAPPCSVYFSPLGFPNSV